MRITDISIEKSAVMRAWRLQVTVMTPAGEVKTDQHFDDMGGFLTAVKDMAVFFTVRIGSMAAKDAQRLSTRPIAPNPTQH